MALLKPSNELDKLNVNMDKRLLQEINEYCDWANIKKMDEFFEQASLWILQRDRDWKAFKKFGEK